MMKKSKIKQVGGKIFLIGAVTFLFLMVALTGGIIGMLLSYSKMLPDINTLSEYRPSETTKIYAANGALLANLYIENRIIVPITKIPEELKLAVIAVEDSRFYEHKGIDIIGILRALRENIRAKRIVEGGSTITQQLARNLYLTHKKVFSRKIQEMLLALQIERQYSKEEILELYLNQIYFGNGAYGVESAAQVYFGKQVKDLNLAESAFLAGLPRAPVYYSPFHNLERAQARQKRVLNKMVDLGFITYEEKEKAEKFPLKLAPPKRVGAASYRAPYFTTYVIDQLIDKYGAEFVYRAGLRVYTTLDLKMQAIADKVLKKGIERGLAQGLNTHQGALVAIEPSTGYIKAMVGGYDFNQSQFNRAWQAKRQPGSAFKPFVYVTALENGFTPNTVVSDSPVEYWTGVRMWRPKNYDGRFRGPITISNALKWSINVVAVKVAKDVGIENVIESARRMGITSLDINRDSHLAAALGGLTYGVSPLEMASAFGVWANGGIRCSPLAITKITYANGVVIEENQPQREEVLDPYNAEVMNSMLQSVITDGTGRRANIDRPAAGKTGTTSDFKDAWFIGYTPELSCAVWIGNDKGLPMRRGVVGGTLPAEIWAEFMRKSLEGIPPSNFPKSPIPPQLAKVQKELEEDMEEIIESEVHKQSGKVATSPELELRKFKRKKEEKESKTKKPSEVMEIEVDICKETGYLATEFCPEVETKKLPLDKVPKKYCDVHR